MKLKFHHILLYLICILASGIILLNRYTPLYINNSMVHFILLFTAASTFVVAIGINFLKMVQWRTILITFLVVFILCFIKAFLTWGGDWKTQTVLYENKSDPAVTVDFQMRGDRFAFGYKRRVIKRERIMPYLDRTTDIDTTKLDPAIWKWAGKEINEMKFPGDYVDVPSYQNEQP